MQFSMFGGTQRYLSNKPIRLISFFSGYDSQALALKYLNLKYEHYKTCEWAINSIQAIKDLHFSNDTNDYSSNYSIEQIKDYLYQKGISRNYNTPLTYQQINKLNEKAARQIYNNIIATKNLVNIQKVKATDLEIKDTSIYDYLITYSFPCQDLSRAGKGKGMTKGDNTRSGMLWEVERILNECADIDTKPQILLMENVPEVVGKNNIKDFAQWLSKLEELGYRNYYQILNAKNFNIPQKRKRCFMVSILGDYYFDTLTETPTKLTLDDFLEDNVDEKYFLSEKMIEYISNNNDKWSGNNSQSIINRTIAVTINTRVGSTRCDCSDYICKDLPPNYNLKNLRIDLKTKNKRLISMLDKITNPNKTQVLDIYNQTINEDMHTIKCNIDKSNMTAIIKNLRIRKLTPRECFRLMGVKDNDFEKIAKNQSNASLYHLAGDSIVVNVLMAIFKNLFYVAEG